MCVCVCICVCAHIACICAIYVEEGSDLLPNTFDVSVLLPSSQIMGGVRMYVVLLTTLILLHVHPYANIDTSHNAN